MDMKKGMDMPMKKMPMPDTQKQVMPMEDDYDNSAHSTMMDADKDD